MRKEKPENLTLVYGQETLEVSFVPMGENKKRRFLIVKENGDNEMKTLLERILKENVKDESKLVAIAKEYKLDEDQTNILKSVVKLSTAGGENFAGTLTSILKEMSESDEDKKTRIQKEEKEKLEKEKLAKEKAEKDKINKEDKSMIKVPVMKEDGSWDLSGVDENLKPSLEVICKSNETLQKTNKTLADQLLIEKNARIMKEFTEKATSMGHVGEEAVKVATILKEAHDVNPESAKNMEAILKSQAEKINEAKLFEEQGTTGSQMHGATAWTKIEKEAELIMKESKISQDEAIGRVLDARPDLYAEYNQEKFGK